MQLKVILTGATGMVGEGVLMECLQNENVKEVLIINRKPAGVGHPKLKEIIHKDFFNLTPIADRLSGYDACFFCLGVSSVGMKEEEYFRLTYTLTMHVAQTLASANPGMTFCYVSGAGTDSSEKGRSMWASVKGKTENDLQKLSFKNVYNFRPGIIKATKGQKNTLKAYSFLGWIYYVIKFVAPKFACSIQEVGKAMINVSKHGYEKTTIEVKDILILAGK